MSNFSIHNNTQTNVRVPFQNIKNAILGTQYELSLVLTGEHLARRLNREFKKKDSPTNVLSFPLSQTEGEIFINLRRAEREARRGGDSTSRQVAHWFIHGCLHLKGLSHGDEMDRLEVRYLTRFM